MTDVTLLALDVGLTRAKAALYRADGAVAASGDSTYPTYRPFAGQAEQSPDDWWTALRQATRLVGARAPADFARIAGVSITGHMHAMVALDGRGAPVGPAIVLGDTRASREAAQISQRLGAASVHRITGALMDASMPAAKAMWLRTTHPDRWERTRLIMGVKDALRHRMTGDTLTDPVDATATSLFDIRTGTWSSDLMEVVGVEERQLPQVSPSDAIAGGLLPEAAAQLNLPPGLPCAVGAGDDVALVGCGALEPGEAFEHIGTTGSIMAVTRSPMFDPSMALETYPHVLAGRWVIGGSITAAGAALAWVADVLGFDDVAQCLSSLRTDTEAQEHPLFLPHLAGARAPVWDPGARGSWVGLRPGFDRSDLASAAFEGVAFALKDVLNHLETLIGSQTRVLVGGRPAGPDWIELRASVYNRTLVPTRGDPTALGAMILLGSGLGLFNGIAAGVGATVHRDDAVIPRPDLIQPCQARFTAYQAAMRALSPIWPLLGRPPGARVAGS